MGTRAIAFCSLMVVCLVTAVASTVEQNHQKPVRVGNGISIEDVRDYRKMFRVNQQPLDMVESTKYMCAPPLMIYGPHYDPGVVYYINEIAKQGLKTFSGKKLLPVGSIIVKEKQERKTEDSVQIITVMKKVRLDHSEESWDFKMYDTRKWKQIDFSQPGTSKPQISCIDCHRRYQDNDFVSEKGMALLLGSKL